MDLLKKANALQSYMTEIRRHLHQNAHAGFSTENADYVKQQLTNLGITPSDCGKAGVTAVIGNGKPVFLLRADMDALPMTEQTELPFASQTDCMHCCGHDMHTAILLGAAKLLKETESALQGSVKLMFQPAEETLEGAKDMIENGILSDPTPDAGMMLHLTVGPVPAGRLYLSTNRELMPSADYFTIAVNGKSCHGSTPEQGIDAIQAAAQILLSLQQLAACERSINDRVVLTVGTITGGSAPNIIADHVELCGTMRCYDNDLREKFKSRMQEIADYTAKACRAFAAVRFTSGTPVFQNNPTLAAEIAKNAADLIGEENVIHAPGSGGGSEDFAYISEKIPVVMGSLFAGGGGYPLHHPQVTFDESVLPIGAAVLAHQAIEFLKQA